MSPRVDLIDDGLVRFPEDEAPATNPELDAWIQEANAQGKALPEPPKTIRAQGPCRLCNERPARHLCVQCRRDACKEDFWVMLGLCRQCLTDQELQDRGGRPPRARHDLGIKWVED